MQKIFYLESDEVWLDVDGLEAGEGAWHARLGREEGADGGGALVDGLVWRTFNIHSAICK